MEDEDDHEHVEEVECCRRMFWLKKIERVPKVTLYAYLFKPNPPNMGQETYATVTLHFMALGMCPEDVLVQLPVARLICGTVLAQGKASTVAMRRLIK